MRSTKSAQRKESKPAGQALGIKTFILFLALSLQSCTSSSEKEPEELIKLRNTIFNSNKNPEKLVADYITHYEYFDFINGAPENINDNIDEVLWKKQLRQSCDTEIFIEKEHKFFYTKELSPMVSNIVNLKNVIKETTYDITLISDYDSLREYERSYTTENGHQRKSIESFIRIDNKWLALLNASYSFANLENMSGEYLEKLNTKKLPMEFVDDKIIIYVQDHYRLYFLEAKTLEKFHIHSNELIGILKKSLVPERTEIIIKAPIEIPFNSILYYTDLLKMYGYYLLALSPDTLSFSQNDLSKYNKKLKTKLEQDISSNLANLNRNVCAIQPVAFAVDSLNNMHILPKHVEVKPIDYELIKHYLMQSIRANYDSLQLKKNWAYCLDLVICPEKIEEFEENISFQDSISPTLINAQKDYLYHLSQLNTETILRFKKSNINDIKKLSLIKEKLNIELQIKNMINIPLSIQEKCDSAAIQVNVFFILLETTDNFTKKSGSGEFYPNKVTLTYRWALKEDVLIFIFTNRDLEHKFQKYVYLQ